MCGIVAACAQRDVVDLLVEGLKRLEYRGYDSAGLAVIDGRHLVRVRAEGKVANLASQLEKTPLSGTTGIAHTRWATHGVPSELNAHPHFSHNEVGLVHNGIIENHDALRDKLTAEGYVFASGTDTEVVVHLLHFYYKKTQDFYRAMRETSSNLIGAYALAAMHVDHPHRILAVRSSCPLVVGIGIGEHFVASDPLALMPLTRQVAYLEDGDIVDISLNEFVVRDINDQRIDRPVHELDVRHDVVDPGEYRHFMRKEIFDQPEALSSTMEARLETDTISDEIFGVQAKSIFSKVKNIHIVACGTSYYSGLAARHWFESLSGISCSVEVASEFRYRKPVVPEDTLFITISQSGETADTLAALHHAKKLGYLASLAICNVPQSSLVRESDLVFMVRAGVEIGVASTKAFTAQLLGLLMLSLALSKNMAQEKKAEFIKQIKSLPRLVEDVLELEDDIRTLAHYFTGRHNALFLGRGIYYSIALEGALKLKEISYIHAEAYPAGELKHGPLALVDKRMPVIAVAPQDDLFDKLRSNLHEVHARGGELIVFTDGDITPDEGIQVLRLPKVPALIAPLVYIIPLQLLAYHVAVLRGTDVDKPRNLAKSVTVE